MTKIDPNTMRQTALSAIKALNPVRSTKHTRHQIWDITLNGHRTTAALLTCGRSDSRWIGRNVPNHTHYWNAISDTEYAIIAAVTEDGNQVEIHLISSKDLISRFEEALAARIVHGSQVQPSSPIFISLDPLKYHDPAHSPGSDVLATATPIAAVEAPNTYQPDLFYNPVPTQFQSIINRTAKQLADLFEVDSSSVHIDVRIS